MRKEVLFEMLEALRLHDANNHCMTVKECAAWLGVHQNTILNRLDSGKIEGVYLGTWRIPKLQFLERIIENEARLIGKPIVKGVEQTSSE